MHVLYVLLLVHRIKYALRRHSGPCQCVVIRLELRILVAAQALHSSYAFEGCCETCMVDEAENIMDLLQ